jgi:hypothetical protein
MSSAQLAIEGYQTSLERDGFVYIEDQGPDFDYFNILQDFGRVLKQYDGEVIWSIRPDERFENTYHSKNTKELQPHSECYEFEGLPPKYLALWCIEPGDEGEGHTHLADVASFMFAKLDDAQRKQLEEIPFRYFSTDGLKSEKLGIEAYHPMLSYSSQGEPVIRFSVRCMDHSSIPGFDKTIEEMTQFIEQNKVSISWKRHSLLIWNNHRMVHSRDAFRNTKRELRRVWLAA